MTGRAERAQMQSVLHLAAILVVVLAHCVAGAHAHDDQLGDASSAHCAICVLAASDDDFDAPLSMDDFAPWLSAKNNFRFLSEWRLATPFDAYISVRGPPHSLTEETRLLCANSH